MLPKKQLIKMRRPFESPGIVFVRVDGVYRSILLDDILYIQAKANYSLLVTIRESLLVHAPIRRFEEVLPGERFYRIHRSYIVGIARIHRFDHQFVWIAEQRLPMSAPGRRGLFSLAPLVGESKSLRNKPAKSV